MAKPRGPRLKWSLNRLLGCSLRPAVLDEKPEKWSSHAGPKLQLSDSAKAPEQGILGPTKRDSEDGLNAYLGRSVLSQANSVATERALKAPDSDESAANTSPFQGSQSASPFASKTAKTSISTQDDRISWGTAHHDEEGPASPTSPAMAQALSSVSLPLCLSFSSQPDRRQINARCGSGRSVSSNGGGARSLDGSGPHHSNFSRDVSFGLLPSIGSSGIADIHRDEDADSSGSVAAQGGGGGGRLAAVRLQNLPKAPSGSLPLLPASRSVSRHLSLPTPRRSASLSHVSSGGSGSGDLSRRHTAVVLLPAEDDDGGSEASSKAEQLQRRVSEVYDQHHVPLEKLRRQMSNDHGSGEDLLQLMARRVFLQQDVSSEEASVAVELEDPSRSPETSGETSDTVLTSPLGLPRIKTKVAKESIDSEIEN